MKMKHHPIKKNDSITRAQQNTTKQWTGYHKWYSNITVSLQCHYSVRLFAQPFVQMQIKENIKIRVTDPLWGVFTDDRWIPRIKGH